MVENLNPGTIDSLVKAWRQGDFVMGGVFFHKFLATCPLSEESRSIEEADIDFVENPVEGLVVVSHSCELVKPCLEAPYVKLSPLIRPEEPVLFESIRNGERPRYGTFPSLHDEKLAVDFHRVQTVEKAVLASWSRREGLGSDIERRAFAQALARSVGRPAFPDTFNRYVGKLQDKWKNQHDKSSDGGKALRSLREIRVRATPSWNAEQISLMFWFIRHDITECAIADLDKQVVEWLEKLAPTGTYSRVDGRLVTVDEFSAREYIESDRLDLEYLSDTP